MRKIVSFLAFSFLFLSLGALALLAAPGGLDFAPGAPASAGQAPDAAQSPDAPAAINSFNAIAMPLDASASIDPFKASGLAAYVGSSVTQVLKWNPSLQTFDSYSPGVSPPFADFELEVGGSYFLELDATAEDVLSLVGDVPAQGTVSFTFTPGSGADDCAFNALSVPLDRADLTKASELANDIGGVDQVLAWNVTNQTFDSYSPGVSPPFADFNVAIGYPYFVCLDDSAPNTWQ